MRHLRLPRKTCVALVLAAALLPALPAHAGTPQGGHPLPPMTRGAFVDQLLDALGVPLLARPTPRFADVPMTDPNYLAITTAATDGLAQGVTADRFAPSQPISALSAATMAIRAYSPVAAVWAAQQGYLPVAVQLGLLPSSFLEAPRRPLDVLQGQRLVAQAASLNAASGPGGWQWLAAPGDGSPVAAAALDVLVAAVSGSPISSVAPRIDPSAHAGVSRSYRRIQTRFEAFAALAPQVEWRVVGGGVWAMRPLGQRRVSADAALILETVRRTTQVPFTARGTAWLGWPASPYFRFDFGEVVVSAQGVAGLNSLKGEYALKGRAASLPGLVQAGIRAFPDWSVMAVGVATAYPTIETPAATDAGAPTSLRGTAPGAPSVAAPSGLRRPARP